MTLLFLRPHVFDKDGFAVCDAFSLFVGQRRAVHLCGNGYPADRYVMEPVGLGIERYQTRLTHASGQFEFHHATRIAFFQQVLFHFGSELHVEIRRVQFRITLATFDLVPERTVGILRQTDAGGSFKLYSLDNGFQGEYGGFVAVEQPSEARFS